jgi:hypothetical protein
LAVDFIALVEALTEGINRAFGEQPAVLLRQHGLTLVLQPLLFGNVFVGGDPAATSHRLPGDADEPAIGQFIHPARNLVLRHLFQRAELLVDRTGTGLALEDAVGDAMADDVLMARADLQQFRW